MYVLDGALDGEFILMLRIVKMNTAMVMFEDGKFGYVKLRKLAANSVPVTS